MTQQKTKILVFMMGAIVLSACQNQPVLPQGAVKMTPEQVDQIKTEEIGTQKLLKLQDQLNGIVMSKDVKKCSEIKDPIYFQSCNVHILANQAVEEKRPDACEKGFTEDVKTTCLFYYEQALKPAKIEPIK